MRLPDSYKGFFAEWREEWSQFFEPCNWRTFHLVMAEFEDDRHMGAVEATFMLLGVGVRLRWNYRVTEDVAGIFDEMNKLDDSP